MRSNKLTSSKIMALFAALFLCISIIGCKTTSKYTSKSGQSKNNANYLGKGGETKEVTAKGLAQITKSGEQNAYDRALQHAMRKAVEKVLGSLVKSTTLVENAVLIEDKIYSKSLGFVQRYEVLSDMKDGETKVVEIKAWVVLGDVKEDAIALGLIQDRVGRPIMLVVFNERNLSGKKTDHAKNAIHQKFLEKEFQFVDEDQLKKVLARRKIDLASLARVKSSKLAGIALDAGAQILLRGKVTSSEQNIASLPENWTSVRSIVNVDAIYAADARILASGSSSKPGARLDKNTAHQVSVKLGAEDVAKNLIEKILNKWDDMVNNGFEYSVLVSGLDFNEAKQVETAFKKNIEGVKKVFNKGFANNNLNLLVRYSGLSSDLAGLLVDPGKSPVKLNVKKYTSKSIVLKKTP